MAKSSVSIFNGPAIIQMSRVSKRSQKCCPAISLNETWHCDKCLNQNRNMKFLYWVDSTLWRQRNETQILKNLWNLFIFNSNAYSFAGILCRHFRRFRSNMPVLKTCCGCWSVRLGAAVLGASETVSCGQQPRDTVRIPMLSLLSPDM